ncbi:MAG: hypothetical protein PWP65_315 [Clostridia bacterium]|nr:hypothetical protein [Clostridia bacterium]
MGFPGQPISPAGPAGSASRPAARQEIKFQDFLLEELAGLKVSQHARQRMAGRNINFTPTQLVRLETAVNKAAAKGARESLVLVDDVALIVSIQNKTVITAAKGSELKGNVFTNIDSAVLA